MFLRMLLKHWRRGSRGGCTENSNKFNETSIMSDTSDRTEGAMHLMTQGPVAPFACQIKDTVFWSKPKLHICLV